ncbi:hypothetical protein [Aquibium microcysteis]|uniref:hypothetical protein n=1 Tax=Aquibium microcysteis TaxID=675281 RepID=UPI00165D050E|nr:hypothetical protein [Aquibium microcysteis]
MVAFFVPPLLGTFPTRLHPVGPTSVFTGDPTTLTGVDFGPAEAKRVWLGVSWSASNNRTLNDVEINGVAATRAGRAIDVAAGSNVEIYHAETAAASGPVALNWSGSINAGICYVFYSDVSLTSTNAGQFSDISSGTDLSATVDKFSRGYLLAGARWGSNRTISWTGADAVPSFSDFESFAILAKTGSGPTLTVGGTLSSATSLRRLVVVAVK